jgi:ATP-dependent exoDNAse (exonuclease V) alpha subunit
VALYRLEVKVVSRAKQGTSMVAGAAYRSGSRLVEHDHGRSAVAASAHLAGVALEDERGGVVHDFRGKAVVCSEIVLPPGAPESFRDREALWNAAEAAETRSNSRVGREILAVLPRELDDVQNLELVRSFVAESLVERGMCVDFAIHAPTASDGLKQPHAHLLCSVRRCDESGFTTKDRSWDKRELVTSLRAEWADCCNQALELAGREVRVDHRSLAAQLEEALERGDFDRAAALDRVPGVHLGPAAHAMERDGIATDLGDTLRAVAEENERRREAYAIVRDAVEQAGPEAATEFLAARQRAEDPVAALDTWGEWLERTMEQIRDLALGAVERVQEWGAGARARRARA